MPRLPLAFLGAIVAGLVATSPAQAGQPTLAARALLPADATWPAPFPGVANADPAPAPGSTQPVGGFSALLDAPGRDTYWAMPDNGFGNKANSRSFLLRLYKVRADWKTAHGGRGTVRIVDVITLRDPDHRIPFAIVDGVTGKRLLTGGDFDIESVRVDRRGDLWFGDEFGPFLVHTDRSGKVVEAPIALPDVKSPDYPPDYRPPFTGPANLNSSNGFEGMALSADGSRLYPTLEGPVTGDDPATRRMYTFDLITHRYTGKRRTYHVGAAGDPAAADLLVSDLTALDDTHLVSLERDNNQGLAAQWKRGFIVDLARVARDGSLAKRQIVDLLNLRDRAGISLPGRPGDIGLGDPFSMPYVTIEAVLPLGGDRLGIVNDTNFGSTGRNAALPDYSDFITVRVPGLRPRRR
jgi:hypothetical protein